jgi:hypothetical protein
MKIHTLTLGLLSLFMSIGFSQNEHNLDFEDLENDEANGWNQFGDGSH